MKYIFWSITYMWNAQILSVQFNNESMYLCNSHHCQDAKHFCRLRKLPCTPSWSAPPTPRQKRQLLSFLSISVSLTCFELCINGIIKYVLFRVWLLLLIMFLWFICITVCSTSSVTIAWIFYNSFICSPLDNCAIMNSFKLLWIWLL